MPALRGGRPAALGRPASAFSALATRGRRPFGIRLLAYTTVALATTLVMVPASVGAHSTHHRDRHGRGHRPGCWTARCDRHADALYARKHRASCSNQKPKACVELVIRLKHIGEPEAAWLRRIPGCESSWNPNEPPNSAGATGLFQFLPSTWAGTPYGGRSIYSAKWQSFAASWLYEKDGGGSEWVCV